MTLSDDANRISALRHQYYRNGYRAVPVRNGQKFPNGTDALDWPNKARRDPPYACDYRNFAYHNTGILCDGFRAVDIDLDGAAMVQAVVGYLIENCGYAPMRYRTNSPRVTALYAAADGDPAKRRVATKCHCHQKPCHCVQAVEVLGRGNQFVAEGFHPSGAPILWRGGSPETVQRSDLPALTEEQVDALLAFCGLLMGAEYHKREDRDRPVITDGHGFATWFIGDVRDALAQIPHLAEDRESWLQIACAVRDATGASGGGYDAWDAWSTNGSTYSPSACTALWNSLSGRASGKPITAGTLYHRVMEANPDWVKPSQTFTKLRIQL
jgi:hypothetical protein